MVQIACGCAAHPVFALPVAPLMFRCRGGGLSRAHSVGCPPCTPRQCATTRELFFWVDVIFLFDCYWLPPTVLTTSRHRLLQAYNDIEECYEFDVTNACVELYANVVLQMEAIATLDADDADRCNIDDLPDPDKYYGPEGSDDEGEEGEEGSSEDGSDSEGEEGSDEEEDEEEDEEDSDEEEGDEEDRWGCVFITFFYFPVQLSYTSWKIRNLII